ncbi:MAG: hypothetical protein D6819_02210 [Gammaproteobacteria bacterium]|nr:MAG: hypothetical protein D6819_02210 [Gammaproteobacteria bacterium]
MSSRGSERLHLRLRPSRLLALVLLLLHGGALLALAPLPWPPWLVLLVSAGVIASLFHSLRRYALLLDPASVVELLWEEDGSWHLLTAQGEEVRARLAGAASYAHLVVLSFRLEGDGGRAVVILPDALDVQSFRRLRMHLSMRG